MGLVSREIIRGPITGYHGCHTRKVVEDGIRAGVLDAEDVETLLKSIEDPEFPPRRIQSVVQKVGLTLNRSTIELHRMKHKGMDCWDGMVRPKGDK